MPTVCCTAIATHVTVVFLRGFSNTLTSTLYSTVQSYSEVREAVREQKVGNNRERMSTACRLPQIK